MTRALFVFLLLAGCGPAVEISGSLSTSTGDAGRGISASDDLDAGLRQRLYDGGPGGNNCPNPSLSSIRERLFLTQCATSGCHASDDPQEGLDLSRPVDELIVRLSQPARQSVQGLPLIKPGQYGASYLYLKMFFETPTQGDQMPPDAPVDPCALDTVRDWIQIGAPAE